jgi:hypothetical protein
LSQMQLIAIGQDQSESTVWRRLLAGTGALRQNAPA